MRKGLRVALLTCSLAACGAGRAADQCKQGVIATLPVTMHGTQPIVAGKINGVEARFLADSGAFFSLISPAGAERFKLRPGSMPIDMRVAGVGGIAKASAGVANDFTLDGFRGQMLHNVEFVVTDANLSDADGVIGQNILGIGDDEFDLGNGAIRLVQSDGCKGPSVAYWPSDNPVAVVDTSWTTPAAPHLIGQVHLNGKLLRAVFDTGASYSLLTFKAAKSVGFKPDDPRVVPGGPVVGVGPHVIDSWIAPFELLDIGGEQIRNARMRVGDFRAAMDADLLLGADFFLSHRLYLARSQHRLYFTFNGGHVFDLSVAHNSATPSHGAGEDSTGPAAGGAVGPPLPDAEAYLRRGTASAARGNLPAAASDLDEAVRLDPTSAEARYQRFLLRERTDDATGAVEDLDEAVRLAPGRADLRMRRGFMRWQKGNTAGGADLEAAAGMETPPGATVLEIAGFYSSRGEYPRAQALLDRWIGAHRQQDAGYPNALNSRCWALASLGKSLEQALADCDLALRLASQDGLRAGARDSRGLVWLRLGNADKAISDYEAALRLRPADSWSLYGLALAEARKGLREKADAHRKAATEISSDIAERFAKIGVER